MFRNILVAVDGSAHSMAAAGLAAELAERAGGRAAALFVKDVGLIRAPYWRDFGALLLPTMRFDNELEGFFQARGEAVLESLRGRHPGLTGRIVEGRPERAILEAARESDLLVMGAAGESHEEGDDHRHLGARVARIVGRSQVPVVLAPTAPMALGQVRLAYASSSGKAMALAADLARTARLNLEAVSLGDSAGAGSEMVAQVLAEVGAPGAHPAQAPGTVLEGLRASVQPGDLLVLSGEDFSVLEDAVVGLGVPVAVSQRS